MDYDDNDIPRNNLQLAGEGRSRSSVLRPYDFPKFDFDDSLQGHMRFDSLVETEVFLGIQSQEDNQWIEDFSRVSNGMEFNPTPADSCSISRRNNVWSEATSSESVEMLLKSVGQEEAMPGEAIVPRTNASDDQGDLTKHVEPGSKLDERYGGCIANSETLLPPNESLQHYTASKEDAEEKLSEVAAPSITHPTVESACGSSCNLTPDAACEKDGTSADQGEHSNLDESGAENLKEPGTSAENFMICRAGEDSLQVTRIINNIDSSAGVLTASETLQQVKISHETLNDDGEQKRVCSGTGQEDSKIVEEEIGDASTRIHTTGSSVCSVTELRVVNSPNAVEAGIDHVRESANRSVKEEPELKLSEGDDKLASFTTLVQTGKREENIFSINSEMANPFEDCQGGSVGDGIEHHLSDSGGHNDGLSASLEKNMDSAAQLNSKQDSDKMEDKQGSPIGEGMSGSPLFSMEGIKAPTERSYSADVSNIGKSNDTALLSSAAENKQIESVEGCQNDSLVTVEEPGAHLPTSVMDESRKVIEGNVAHMQPDFSETEQETSKTLEEDEKLGADPENVGSGTLTTEQRMPSPDAGNGVKDNETSHARISNSAALGDHFEGGLKEQAVVQLSHLDKVSERAATDISSDAKFRTEAVSISTVDAGGAPVSEMVAKSPQPVAKSNDVSSSASPMVAASGSLYLDDSKDHLGCNKSISKETVNADLVSGGNHEVTKMKEEGEKESAQPSDVDKASCDSPTIISSSEPSRMEKEDQEDARGFEVADKFVKDTQSISEDLKKKDALGDDTSFTFKVNALPDISEREPGKGWSPFPNVEKCKSSMAVEKTTASGKGKTERTPSLKTPRQNVRVPDGEHVHGTSKGPSERKGRRASSKGMAKENNKKGSNAKATNQESGSVKGDKGSHIVLSTSSSSPHVQFGQMQPYGHIEQSTTKVSATAAVITSNLPDLNTSGLNNSTSSSATFRQPFTDLQQVQLRAQIFVYGSLIQGTAPDEACMVSAFGPSDGGRSVWEPVWRASIERVRSQKSNSSAAETPLHSQSAVRVSDAAVKQDSHSSKVLSSPVSRPSSKVTSAVPIIPLSSPLWSISTPSRDSFPSSGMHKGPVVDYQHAVTPLHSFQTPPIRNFVGHSSWPSQTCFPGPWLASPQPSSFTSSVRFQPVTMTETVKLTPVKDTSGSLTSGMKNITSSPAAQTLGSCPVYVGVSTLPDSNPITPAEQQSVDSKHRKRKKVPASDACQVPLLPEARLEPVVASNVATAISSPVSVPAPACPLPDAVLSKSAADASTVCSIDHPEKVNLDTRKDVACSEETLNKVVEAKSQAEDAAAFAASAVNHSEDLWSQLSKQKEYGMASDVEARLVSAAAAIAAAASVAKAAAAAAKVACNAALQAKLMADEALVCSKTSGLVPSGGISSTDVQDVGNATPASILKGDNITNQSGSILLAAKEAAKRRVEAASAASKQAENLDAIVKAAELAATAVSQAGKIVAMGEPLSLSDLVEAGPDGYWKLPQHSSELGENLKDRNKEQAAATSLGEDADTPTKVSGEKSVEKGGSRTLGHGKIQPREKSNDSFVDCITGSVTAREKDFGNDNVYKASDTVFQPDTALRTGNIQSEHDDLMGALLEDSIKEGSAVEVFKCGDGLKSAWYTANVLKIEDGKAYVCYTDLLSEGSENLREWVPVGGEEHKAPIIRASHPSTTLPSQATRKRRRAALADYAWCVGDRVDVWIDDCWWEGVVTEKNDETTLKVHFPVQGETSTVRAWNLRTSRSWTDGKWVEWSSLRGHNASEQSDAPQEKRQRLGSPPVATKGKDKSSNDMDSALEKPRDSKLLALSTSDRIFDIGKSIKEDNNRGLRKPWRTGKQKEASRVVFGVPKPTGKKRKFMEVSKHFPAGRNDKSKEANDPIKFAKFLIPQGTASRGWKAPSRNDSKGKRSTESTSRVPTSRKPHRTLPPRDNLNSTLAQDNDSVTDHGTDVEDSVGHDESTSEKNGHGFSACEEPGEAPLSSLLGASSKKSSLTNTRSERVNRGKIVPTGAKLSKIEEDKVYAGNSGKSLPEAAEPRRSNRRIQPTHRLLEGLQSSMIIPKMPSASHDKVQKNPSRIAPARGK